ncbi:coiled-coil domain-containing protein 127-like [Ambystoma mexicanum]|uniref:coiled-coil domain-containing protein 127-like n=1 Tax=Ambystoma mexicanum TaxID=8296 RepID=UPI0037E7FB1B
MNNLNNPPQWNIEPHPRGDGGDGNRWNYTLLVPLLCLAAFRWVWTRDSKREIEKVKQEHSKDLYRKCLAKEEERQIAGRRLVYRFEDALMERQNIFCSPFLRKGKRLEIEDDLLRRAMSHPVAQEIQLEEGLRDIFRNDRHCAGSTNTDKRKNGRLMWVYLRHWEKAVEHEKCKRIENVMLGKTTF